LDYEKPIYTKSDKQGMVDFCKDLTDAVHENIAGGEVSFDVPYSPWSIACITGRCLYWDKMAEALDYILVMSYDHGHQLMPV